MGEQDVHRTAADERPDRPGEQQPRARFADLPDRPVAEHVGVFEAEHTRLQQELSSIDEL
jgi:hypothetical protein